jgi:hypothetical protein
MRREVSVILGGGPLYTVGWLLGRGGNVLFGFGTRIGPCSRRSSKEAVC